MSNSSHIKLPLTGPEKARLRRFKVRVADIPDQTTDDLQQILGSSSQRAIELRALAQFQTISSVGIKFAEDLVFLGYYSIDELKAKTGAELTNAYELKKGFRTDPCVEDQFRLAVYVSKTGDLSKNWWDFSKERKSYRLKNDYPTDRPKISWFEMPEYNLK